MRWRSAPEVGHHRLGVLQARLGVDHPILLHQGIEAARQCACVLQPGQLTLPMARPQLAHEVAPEVAGQGPDRKEIVASGRLPRALLGQGAARDQTVHMQMPGQGLPPGVQQERRAELAAEAFGVGGKGRERRPGALQELLVDHLRVQLHPGIEALR